MSKEVCIWLAEYERLLKDSRKLECLYNAGIDNTDAYEYGLQLFYENFPEYDDDNEDD